MATKTLFIMEWRIHIWSVSRIETYKVYCQYDVIPYSCGLLDYIGYRMILREFGGGPCPPYIVPG